MLSISLGKTLQDIAQGRLFFGCNFQCNTESFNAMIAHWMSVPNVFYYYGYALTNALYNNTRNLLGEITSMSFELIRVLIRRIIVGQRMKVLQRKAEAVISNILFCPWRDFMPIVIKS